MNLHALLGHIDDATAAGDLSDDSPVFAVVRNPDAALSSTDAWHAISIVDVKFDAPRGRIELIADESADATDITVASLRSRVAGFPRASSEGAVFAGTSAALQEASVAQNSQVVEAYGDEHGLGLMLWFPGYEKWLKSQS